jgi:hypothetical protein
MVGAEFTSGQHRFHLADKVRVESMLTTGELSTHHAHCVTLYHNDLTCEADTLGRQPRVTGRASPPAELLQVKFSCLLS